MPVKSGQTGQDLKVAFGTATTVTAADTIVTGLKNVQCAVANFSTDVADANLLVSCVPNGTAGTFTLKTWKTDGADPTPAAASVFSKVVNWVAWGW